MSELMRAYLKSWLEWAEGEAKEGAPYTRCYGLCANRRGFARFPNDRAALLDELQSLFHRDRLNTDYPFGIDDYEIRTTYSVQHRCEVRLAWVRSKLAA